MLTARVAGWKVQLWADGHAPIQAQAHSRHCIGDGIDVVGLKGAHSRHVVGLVQRPACLVLVPQCLVCPSRPHLHAHLHSPLAAQSTPESSRVRSHRNARCMLKSDRHPGQGNLIDMTFGTLNVACQLMMIVALVRLVPRPQM